jgi:probable HAF family extracellular repeat protein
MTSLDRLRARTRTRLAFAASAAAVVVTTLGVAPSAAEAKRHPDTPEPTSDTPVFVLERGRFTGFDVPGPSPQDITRVNNRGQIVGGIRDTDTDTGFRGYVRDRRGRYEWIDFPGAASTTAFDIDDSGRVVGIYSNTSPTTVVDDARGFLRDERGRYWPIRVPGARKTQAFGINNRGQVVGEYLDADGVFHGYVWQAGRFTTIDRPGAVATNVLDINYRGQLIGIHVDDLSGATIHGYLLDKGVYTDIDTPGVPYTFPFALNNRGQIAGFTGTEIPVTASGSARGFVLRHGTDGRFTPVNVPGAAATGATGINDKGTIVGLYANPNATPSRQSGTGAAMDWRLPEMLVTGTGK